MNLTIYNFIFAFLWFNIFVIVCLLYKRNEKLLIRFGIWPFVVTLVLGLLRFCVVFEYPFTVIIRSTSALPKVVDLLRSDVISGLSWINLILGVWIIGTAVMITRIFESIKHQNKAIEEIELYQNDHAQKVLDRITGQRHSKAFVRVFVSPNIKGPIISGFLHPVILLPQYELTDTELECVILHEWSHYKNKDNWIKLFVNAFCAIFWWNPLVHLLKRRLNFILELNSDRNATKCLGLEGRLFYTATVGKVIRLSDIVNVKEPVCQSALSITADDNKLVQRFEFLLTDRVKLKSLSTVFIGLVLALSLLSSYLFVVQPASFPDELELYESETIEIAPENSYIKVTDGQYALYVDGIFYSYISEDMLLVEPHASLIIVE